MAIHWGWRRTLPRNIDPFRGIIILRPSQAGFQTQRAGTQSFDILMWGGVWGGGGIQQILSGYYCYMEHFDHELCWSCYAWWCLTWCSYCIQYIVWDEAIYPCPKFIGEVWEYISNSPHTSLGILLLSHAEIKVNPYRYKGPLFDCLSIKHFSKWRFHICNDSLFGALSTRTSMVWCKQVVSPMPTHWGTTVLLFHIMCMFLSVWKYAYKWCHS